MNKHLLFIAAVLLTAQLQAQTITWTGAGSTDWNTSANWSNGQVPTASNDVIIAPASSQPVISATGAVAQTVEVQSGATLTIESAGSLAVNGSRTINYVNTAFYNNGIVQNSGQVQLGNLSTAGNWGLQNQGAFTNNTGGQISIDRSVYGALYNYTGTFTNAGVINIGANTSVGGYGITNDGLFVGPTSFYNNAGGQIRIDNTSTYGLTNNGYGSTFTNAGILTIGANASVGSDGLFNYSGGTFNNNTGGQISIDRSSDRGLSNYNGSTFTNAGVLNIGVNASVGSSGLYNYFSTFINSNCGTLTLFTPLNNQSNLSNQGLMIVSTTGTHTNYGFTNNGVLVYPLNNPIPNVSNGGVIASPLDICGSQITPALQLGSSNPFTVGDTWYSDAALSQPSGTYSNNSFTASGLSTGTGTVYFTVSNGNCTQTVSLPVTLSNSTGDPGDPAVFGNNVWNVYAWNDGNSSLSSNAWQNNYRGYYTDTALSFDTRNKWADSLSPSYAPGYQGCPVQRDLHSWSAKRQGFACGYYRIDIPGHDDAGQLFIDGNKVWEHNGCCDPHFTVWQGVLGPTSRVEFRATEGFEASYGAISIIYTGATPVISGVLKNCTGSNTLLTSSGGSTYQWYLNGAAVNGATSQTYSASTAGSYTVQVSGGGCAAASSVPYPIVIGSVGDPSVFGDNVWNVYAWNAGNAADSGQSWNTDYKGYYVENGLSFETINRWNPSTSPSSASGYQGCPVGFDHHSWSAKRKGFPCGHYKITITRYDEAAQLLIDGVKVWEHNCCDVGDMVWEGDLGANSKIEFRVTEGTGTSFGGIQFTLISPTINAGGPTGLCTGESVTLTSNFSSGNQWYKDGLALDGDTGKTYVATQAGQYTTKVAISGCTFTSLPVNVTVTTPPGDPSVFGDNKWNVYAWNDGNGTLTASAWQNNYRGYYTDTTLYFATKWYTDASPSEVTGYQGCSVGADNHSWSAKRKGFPCGQYRLWIVWHDDAAQLFIDGVKVWEHDACCDQHDSAWQGYLNADSRVEFRGTEGSQVSNAILGIYQIKPVITVNGSNIVCSGFPVTLTASSGTGYIWSTGESTQGISVTQAGTYTVSQTDNCGNLISSNPATVIALAAPVTVPADTFDLNLHNGTIRTTGYSGDKYAWYKTGETAPVGNNTFFAPTKEGDYYVTESRDNCTSPASKIVHVIDPVPFGDNIWYVHYFPDYNGDASDPDYNYYGYYADSSLSFDTRSRWDAETTPAFASGYQGLQYYIEYDNFKFLAKRKGFPCGHYKINIPWHDDHMELWINGVKVFAHYDCCDSHPDVWEGDLGPNSAIELKVIEEYGDAIGAIKFELMNDIAKPAITPQGPVNICSLDSLKLTSTTANGNVWSTGDTTQSITVRAAGSYAVVTSSEGCTAQSDPVDVTVTSAQTYYADADHDGYGDAATSLQGCVIPPGYVNDHTDCNDNDSTKWQSALLYVDADGDGYTVGSPISVCYGTAIPTGYRLMSLGNDCNDNNAAVYPGAPEICDGLDNNCNGQVDEVKAVWYRDADGDGYGNPAISITACAMPAGYVANNTDCNDKKATVYPGAPEICDGLDNNCNGQVDEGVTTTWYRDADGDSYGDPALSTVACKKPTGYVANNTDCNDANAAINPATKWYKDADNDGYYTGSAIASCTSPGAGYKSTGLLGGNDCNDNDNTVYPKAPELCDGKDNNCNGTIDEGCATLSIDDVSMTEGNKGKASMTFTISLSAASTKKVTVQFATSNGTATAGSDYDTKSGTITFSQGVTKQTINISIIGDKTIEQNETFLVNLSSPVNATIAKGTGTGTIINDDGSAIASAVSSVKTSVMRSVKISPIPANSILRIDLSGYAGNVTLQLISMQGKMLLQKKIQATENFAKEQISVSGFANGTYLLAVIDDKGNMKTEKVIISH